MSPEEREAFRKKMEREIQDRLPSAGELASLAAQIAGTNAFDTDLSKEEKRIAFGPDLSKEEKAIAFDRARADKLARKALVLWEACKIHLGRVIDNRVELEMWLEDPHPFEQLPQPRTFPVSFEDFLRLVVRGKDEATREGKFKGFLRDVIRANKAMLLPNKVLRSAPETTLDEMSTALERCKREGFSLTSYYEAAMLYENWRANHISEVRSKAGKAPDKSKDGPPKDESKTETKATAQTPPAADVPLSPEMERLIEFSSSWINSLFT